MHLKSRKKLKTINKNLEEKVNENVQRKLEDIKLASIGKMATAITHELNTPITYMKSNLEMMAHDINSLDGNEETKKYLIETLFNDIYFSNIN